MPAAWSLRRGLWGLILLVALATPWSAAAAEAAVADFRIAEGHYGEIHFRDLSVTLQRQGRSGGGTIRLARLDAGGQQWHDLDIRCAALSLRDGRLACRDGRVQAAGAGNFAETLQIDALQIDTRQSSFRLHAHLPRHKARIEARSDGHGGVQLEFAAVPVAALAAYLPALAAWSPDGLLQASVQLTPGAAGLRARIRGTLRDARFASADALQAGENLVLAFKADVQQRGAAWQFNATADWQAGEVYLHPVYLKDGARLVFDGSWQGKHLRVREAVLDLPGAQAHARDLRLQLAGGPRLQHAEVELTDADLARLGPQFIAPLLAPERGDDVSFGGRFGARVRVRDGALVEADARFDDVSLQLDRAQLGFGPVRGTMNWRAGEERRTQLRVAGGHWQQIALGAFDVNARVGESYMVVDDLVVPVLDSRVRLSNLHLGQREGGWFGGAAAVIEAIDMQRLTATLGWPSMRGTLAASMPQVRIEPGHIALDGALVVNVFDGYIKVSGLRVAEPFGVGSYLEADVEARHLDLYPLTETFSFGSIEGLIDVDVKALALADWVPVAFDADLRSASGRYRRRISQRAVENITALGGAGAVAAIQRTFLSVFKDFGYRDIRVACRLRNGVCTMDGIAGADSGAGHFTLIRGGGVPALNVVGYNRRVDWVELLERLQRVIASNASPVIR